VSPFSRPPRRLMAVVPSQSGPRGARLYTYKTGPAAASAPPARSTARRSCATARDWAPPSPETGLCRFLRNQGRAASRTGRLLGMWLARDLTLPRAPTLGTALTASGQTRRPAVCCHLDPKAWASPVDIAFSGSRLRRCASARPQQQQLEHSNRTCDHACL
jgi:hypothetical protein